MKTVLTFALIGCLATAAIVAQSRSAADFFQEALQLEEVKGDLQKAIATYESILQRFPEERAVAARAQLHIGLCYERMGNTEASKAYEKVVRDYADQKDLAAQAKTRLVALGDTTGPARDTAVVARQVWTGSDVDLQGKPSSDGRFLTFVDGTSTSTGNVAVRDLTSGENRLLTHATSFADGNASYPVLSPDGKQVAYKWYGPAATSPSSLRLIGIDGSRPRVLLQQAGIYLSDLAWSPDGKRIAAVLGNDGGDNTSHIALVSVADGSVTRLKSTGWRAPRLGGFSPDGRLLVYSLAKSPSANDGGIFAVAVDGSGEVVLVQGPANDTQPVWTPDGKTVFFVSDRSGTPGLWSIGVKDGKPHGSPELVRANMGEVVNMGFSRDGSYFYGAYNSQNDVFLAGIDPDTLNVTAPPTRISDRFIGSNSGAAWSPDGRLIAFIRGPDPRAKTLVVRSVPDGGERTLPTKFMKSGWVARQGPTWFGDSHSLLVPDIDTPNQQVTFRRIDIETGQEALVFQGRDIADITVSRDGTSLYYTTWLMGSNSEPRISQLMRRDIETGKETELYRAALVEPMFGLAVSPDGGQLAFLGNAGPSVRTLMTISTRGGTARELYRGDYQQLKIWRSAWTKDGRYLLVVAGDGPGQNRLWAFPVGGGEPRKLDLKMQQIMTPDLSPDGRHLVFTGVQSKPELWVIKNLLPDVRAAR